MCILLFILSSFAFPDEVSDIYEEQVSQKVETERKNLSEKLLKVGSNPSLSEKLLKVGSNPGLSEKLLKVESNPGLSEKLLKVGSNPGPTVSKIKDVEG